MKTLISNKKLIPSIEIPRPIRIFAQCLQLISHRVTVLFATKLFSTPFNFKTPEREKAMERSAQHKKLYIPAINKEVRVLSYGYSKKKVLLVHGWGGRSTQLFMFADALLEKGYMIISFDGPAHGASSGKTTNLKEFMETILTIHNTFGPFEAAVGHSFGALALLNIVAQKPVFKKLVTVGCGDKISGILYNFTGNLGLKPVISKKMNIHLEKKWNLVLKDFDGHEVAKKIKIPTLVVHDTLDGDVAVSCAENIRQNLRRGSLLVTHGLGHTKILRNQGISRKIITFITKDS